MTARRRRILLGVLAALAAILALAAWKLPGMGQLAIDTSAKWACQCRYMDGGGSEFCVAEDPLGFGGTGFRFDPDNRQVTASIWGLVEATGRYEPGRGCMVR
ncbi:hypothetical protein [Emcibacter sp. SYSU 3D8]|uniref:hypothetical protein n=1 Tax=Emcibacter sp. SYSU 3D8 TaxID=3133969 RepID=UPI0031FF0627